MQLRERPMSNGCARSGVRLTVLPSPKVVSTPCGLAYWEIKVAIHGPLVDVLYFTFYFFQENTMADRTTVRVHDGHI